MDAEVAESKPKAATDSGAGIERRILAQEMSNADKWSFKYNQLSVLTINKSAKEYKNKIKND